MRRSSLVGCALAGLSWLHLSAPASASDLVTANARIDRGAAGRDPSLYLAIQNRGDEVRHLVGGSCSGCADVEIHRAVLKDGAMVSVVLPEWEIPARGSVAFAPRGLFLALVGLTGLSDEDSVAVELAFANGEKISFDAVVRTR